MTLAVMGQHYPRQQLQTISIVKMTPMMTTTTTSYCNSNRLHHHAHDIQGRHQVAAAEFYTGCVYYLSTTTNNSCSPQPLDSCQEIRHNGGGIIYEAQNFETKMTATTVPVKETDENANFVSR